MVLDFVECRVANPVKLIEWGAVEEGQRMVCGCCGWSGRLGECQSFHESDGRAYACAECSMPLLMRVLPKVYPMRSVATLREWRAWDQRASNG